MATGDLIERTKVALVAALGEARTVEQLVCDSPKRRYHNQHGLAATRLENDRANCPDGRGRGKGRPTKFENLHGKLCSVPHSGGPEGPHYFRLDSASF